jgi:hypothetical protein
VPEKLKRLRLVKSNLGTEQIPVISVLVGIEGHYFEPLLMKQANQAKAKQWIGAELATKGTAISASK